MLPRLAQKDSKSARTRLVGLFAAVWVGLALQPCAVAAVSESDCPHCPPQAEQVAPAHESHCDPVAKVSPDKTPDCDAAQADCCGVVEGTVNVRVDTTDGDDEPIGPPTALPSSYPDPGFGADDRTAAGPPEPSGGSVPLHVLKCVYLN